MTQGYPPTNSAGFPSPFGAPPFAPPPAGVAREKRRYSIFAPWVMWYSPELWRDVGKRWRGICFWYLFLLLLVTWTIGLVKVYFSLGKSIRDDAPALVDQVPQVTITNGVISIDRPEPYTITDPQTKLPLVVFDTSGTTTQPPPNAPSVLVTKSSIVMRKSAMEMQTTDLSQIQSFQMDANSVRGWLKIAHSWFLPIAVPAAVLFSMIVRLVQLLIYGGIGMAIASSMRAPLTFAGTMRLSAVAITPVILIDTLVMLAGFSGAGGCFWTLGGIAVEVLLLVMAIRANAPVGPGPAGPGGFPVQQPWGAPAFPPPPGPGNPM